MASNRFLVAGGDGNWNNTNNWAATSGGSSGQTVPVAGDIVAFDSLSGNANMTVNVSSACASLIMSGTYTGTLTFNNTLTLTSTCTFLSGCTIAGTSGTLACTATATLTSGGKTLTCALTLTGTSTFTLGDNWTVNGLVTIGITTLTTTVNSNQITCAGGYHQGGTSASVFGTSKLVLTGGTWDSTSSSRTGNNIDLAGNVTVSGTVVIGAGILTYLSGTITTTSSTLNLSSNNTTLNTAGVTWNNITTGLATYTNSSTLNWSGTLAFTNTVTITGAGALNGTGAITFTGSNITINNTGGITTTGTMTLPNANMTFAGSAGFTVGTLTTASVLSVTRTHTLTFGNTYTVTTAIGNNATAANRQALVSSSPGNKVIFNLSAGAVMTLLYCDPTDINSSGGSQIISVGGTITTSLNWSNTITAGAIGGPRILHSSIIEGRRTI